MNVKHFECIFIYRTDIIKEIFFLSFFLSERKKENKQVQDNVSFLITSIHLIYPYVLYWAHVIVHAPYVLYHLFNDLDYRQSDSNNDVNPVDLFVIPIHYHEDVINEFGLLDDDDDNLTLLGKIKIMI